MFDTSSYTRVSSLPSFLPQSSLSYMSSNLYMSHYEPTEAEKLLQIKILQTQNFKLKSA